ncbi:Hypothetical protein, putative [Bodo saltans]|uniref:CCHC-type domain-containing protein n=1 Tax=Bodo saltans TaxID=75058 RepID=A0A0S4JNP6_BODSA|nr:Hypothetical protein, putative [Bodo saltans]|eukprot:CUG93184.1 Hypothetical protein, putative [Bodo saltans]
MTVQMTTTSTDIIIIPQRVQIRMRGVRFETSVDVLSTYSRTYQRMFDLWRNDSDLRDSVLALFDPKRRVNNEASSDEDNDARISVEATSILGKAFTEVCLPPDAPFSPPIRQATLRVHPATSKVPPVDDTGLYWFWDFSVLKDDPSTSTTGFWDFSVLKDDPSTSTTSSKFGAVTAPKNELQPEFAGTIFVFLRKLYQQRQQQQQQGEGEAPTEPPKPVKFTARWNEMPFDQQRSLCDVVNILDIQVLKELGYGVPTADPSAGDGYVANGGDPAAGDTNMVDKALEYLAIQRNIHNPQGTALPHPSTDDDTLEMPASGCAKCGTSGHPTESCPY